MQTESRYICLLGASGHAGMEAGIANLTEPGDKVIIINQGVWGWKAAEMARRYGGTLCHCTARALCKMTRHQLFGRFCILTWAQLHDGGRQSCVQSAANQAAHLQLMPVPWLPALSSV